MARLKTVLSLPLTMTALLAGCAAMDQLSVAFEWKILDFEYPSELARSNAITNFEFIPENNIPTGIEVYKDRLFITVPRWKTGVASSLNYIRLNGTNKSPKLIPYPNWAAHQGKNPEIASPFRVRADRCGRLWVVDTGFASILTNRIPSEFNKTILREPAIIVYDLKSDNLIRRYPIPESQRNQKTFLGTIAVDDNDCDDTFAYIADVTTSNLLVYSWKKQSSWKITHHFFNMDPLATDFNVLGQNFQWDDAIFGMALTAPAADGFPILYFHPMASFNEFSVSTKVLRDPKLAETSFNEFKLLGNRGPNSQAGVSFIDKKSGVLFYSLLNLNAVACWKTSNRAYTKESQGRIYMSNVTMVLPSDLKVDYDDKLWILSNKLQKFMYSKLNYDEVNFRILMNNVTQAIKGTACDTNPNITPDLINKLGIPTGTTKPSSGIRPTISAIVALFVVGIRFISQ